ncbi:MAG: hypothetical protein EOP46_03910 [Sphingobacteriaceae bacterium]|nr:MAG: hypothetical protein EOP46_03910 [Sphingobacteriaceae bacterium]
MATKYYIDGKGNPSSIPDKSGSLWHEMKPFVKFGFKALGIMGGALVSIVKAIPKPWADEDKKDVKVIKIK